MTHKTWHGSLHLQNWHMLSIDKISCRPPILNADVLGGYAGVEFLTQTLLLADVL